MLIHFAGPGVLHAVLPPAVTGAVVMLIGFNLAPVVADIYWPQDQWIALATMAFVIVFAVGVRGFLGRIAIFLGLIFGYVLSWIADAFGQINSVLPGQNLLGPDGKPCDTEGTYCVASPFDHDRVSWAGVKAADWVGLPAAQRRKCRGLALAELLAHLHPARAARGDRPDRREHRAREGGRGDDASATSTR